jgi:hypothetical protein
MADSTMPPLPPAFPAGGAGQGSPPGMMPPGGTASPGQSQVGGSVIKLAMEIDQALKTLAQAVPSLAPFVEQTLMQLRQQIGQALQSGAVNSNPTPGQNDQVSFPGGGGRM